MRSHPGLIIKMGGEIQYGWQHKAHSVGGVDRQSVAGARVAVEHEHPAFVERQFRGLPFRLLGNCFSDPGVLGAYRAGMEGVQ